MDKAKLGAYLKELRIQKGLSLNEVGEATGLFAGYIFRIEKGTKTPSMAIAGKLASFYGIGMEAFIRKEEDGRR